MNERPYNPYDQGTNNQPDPYAQSGQPDPYAQSGQPNSNEMNGQPNPYAQSGQPDPYTQLGQNNPYEMNGQPDPYAQSGQQNPYTQPVSDPFVQRQQIQNSFMQSQAQYNNPPKFEKSIDPSDYDKGLGNRTANIICVVSLVCYFIAPSVMGTMASSLRNALESANEGAVSPLSSLLSILCSISGLAAWVLMIFVRVKYPKNVFGKVLMWIYIGLLILTIIVIAVIIVACVNIFKDCPG